MADMIWLCGRPSAGKTTLAHGLQKLMDNVVLLDGDDVRRFASPEIGYTKEDRYKQMLKVAGISYLINKSGINTIICTCSPPPVDDFPKAAKLIQVYVKCSLEECIKRDVKGLYERGRGGNIDNVFGIDIKYEEPANPDVVIDTNKHFANESIKELYRKVKSWGCEKEIKKSKSKTIDVEVIK